MHLPEGAVLVGKKLNALLTTHHIEGGVGTG
jgi:hypothetical protein